MCLQPVSLKPCMPTKADLISQLPKKVHQGPPRRRRPVRVLYPAQVRKYLPPKEKDTVKKWLLILGAVVLLQIFIEDPDQSDIEMGQCLPLLYSIQPVAMEPSTNTTMAPKSNDTNLVLTDLRDHHMPRTSEKETNGTFPNTLGQAPYIFIIAPIDHRNLANMAQ
ncbi:uncharacterized protein O3C94_013088 [Discoglossus pictus]